MSIFFFHNKTSSCYDEAGFEANNTVQGNEHNVQGNENAILKNYYIEILTFGSGS